MNTLDYTAQIRALCDQIDAEYNPIHPPGPGPGVPATCYFGYYGDTPTIVAETKDHANLTWVYGWPTGSTAISTAIQAQAAGNKIVLGVYPPNGQAGMEYFFNQFPPAVRAATVMLYPFDEPDVNHIPEATVLQAIKDCKAAAAKFPEMSSVAVGVIYGVNGTPGIQAYDWIGRDNYGNGPQSLPLLAHQRLMIVPGGANPWRESPLLYVSYALAHQEVVAVIPFIWDSPSDQTGAQGIKGNGMAPAYRAAGQTLTGRK